MKRLWTLSTLAAFALAAFAAADAGADTYKIMDRGAVIGKKMTVYSDGKYPHAFVYDKSRGYCDLNDFLPADCGWVLTEVLRISDAGEITGRGIYNGQYREFSMTPVYTSSPILQYTIVREPFYYNAHTGCYERSVFGRHRYDGYGFGGHKSGIVIQLGNNFRRDRYPSYSWHGSHRWRR